MFSKDLISKKISALKPSDNAEVAIELMNEFKVSHLPVVDNKNFVGLLSEKNISELHNIQEPISFVNLSLFTPFVRDNQHFFYAIEIAVKLQLSLVPVLNEKDEYLGCILLSVLLRKAANLLNTNGPGGIIILQVHEHDYTLSEIARIVENENAKILSATSHLKTNGFIYITLKINSEDINSILKSFERFEYEIISYFINNSDEIDVFQQRLKEFIHYLQI